MIFALAVTTALGTQAAVFVLGSAAEHEQGGTAD
jgi:hypothetical protein